MFDKRFPEDVNYKGVRNDTCSIQNVRESKESIHRIIIFTIISLPFENVYS